MHTPEETGTEPSRPRSPRGQGERLRRDVLDAVNRVLVQDGGERLTMRAVAREAGVTAPSIYLHFTDKADLVWAALTDKYAQLAAEMDQADVAAATRSTDDLVQSARLRLQAQMHAYVRFAVTNPGHYRLMFEIRQPSVSTERAVAHPSRLVSSSLREAVARCAEAGAMLRLPRRALAHTLWSTMHGLVSLNHSLGIDDAEDLARRCADDVLDSLIPRDGPAFEPPDSLVERAIREVIEPRTS
ncbi:TetR/AcrR family transcriptional regulator [Pseudonocardia sp. KRD291]|uniref:TetR/AcrR family transcriptional regulator n=1 Tax=Pseudonocardia sp. KRD291 TaxID=2792007 RepID=UPI001C4A01E5|nr:TetR/AcrR family transcriptional regulator [Pseudonocardia sp. KRD291]MBW0101236.1 TetR/AcrR family transcriptional regulator [Pseudonocardia sp. KRD291]